MKAAALGRALPSPVKRALKLLTGWAYSARRRLRALRGGRGRGAAGAASGDGPTGVAFLSASNKHGSFCVPVSSQERPVAQAILHSQVWEADTLDLLCSLDPGGDVVHAGTFFGDFLPALAHSRAPGAIVWAFEPSAENHECTRRTIALNQLENVRLAHAGLDAAGGVARLATSDRQGVALGGASRVIKDEARARWVSNEEIELRTVDEALGGDRAVAGIHFDVEGHEQSALEGALRTIERCRPVIVLETLPAADWLAANLAPLGYRVEGKVNINHVLRCSAQ